MAGGIKWSELRFPPLNLWNFPNWSKDKVNFKIGDAVVVCDEDSLRNGMKGVVVSYSNDRGYIDVQVDGGIYSFFPSELRYETLDDASPEQWDNLRPHGITVLRDIFTTKAKDKQVAGTHYKDMKIQPVEYIMANGLGFCEGNVVKYVTRYTAKGGIQDLEKAKHYIELLIEELQDDA